MRAGDSTLGSHSGRKVFATTHWSVIRAAAPGDGPAASDALERLCRLYWYPLYAFIRRQGHTAEDAQDLTQAFFARILEKDFLRTATPDKGRFRSFLLASLKNFISDQWQKSRALKRGGPDKALSLSFDDAEERYSREPMVSGDADFVYDRRWAFDLLERVLERLREEMEARGKMLRWEQLQDLLFGPGEESYAAVGTRLGMTEDQVRLTVHRMRRRFRHLLLVEIGQTVEDQHEAEEEMRYLLSVVSRSTPRFVA